MTATREQDEVLLSALRLLKMGVRISAVARRLGKDPGNLTKAVRAVLRDDLEHDDPISVVQHYPSSMIGTQYG